MKNPFAATHVLTTGRRAILTTAVALTIGAGAISGPALAQDGTGAATPTPPSACEVIPARVTSPVESSPAATESASPVASPVTDLTGTPVSATPVAAEDEAAVDPLTEDLQASAVAIAGCLTDGNVDTLAALTGGLYRGQLVGFGEALDPADFTALAASLPAAPYQILSVTDATFTEDDTASAVVTYEVAHQVRKSTWDFSLQDVQGTTAWVLESETPMAPEAPEGTTTVEVTIKDNAFALKEKDVAGPSVAITATNNDKTEHELLVLRFAGDATTQTLLQSPGPALPKDVTFIGQITIPAGESGTLLLSGMQPGTYTIVDMLPNAEGLPNLVDGMEATLQIK